MKGTSTHTIYRQPTIEDAIDVARREAEASGFRVLGVVRPPHRGTIPGTWVVELTVERRA